MAKEASAEVNQNPSQPMEGYTTQKCELVGDNPSGMGLTSSQPSQGNQDMDADGNPKRYTGKKGNIVVGGPNSMKLATSHIDSLPTSHSVRLYV